jgi:hypothetical protein
MLHRAGLDLQFLWAALQAIEKYFKAILLFNGRSARGLGHGLLNAYERVLSIDDIPFDFPEQTREFLDRLESFGPNRYLQRPYSTWGDELALLDQTVWSVRRYCQYLRTEVGTSRGRVSILAAAIASLQSPRLRLHPRRFSIVGGHLESILRDTRNPLRPHLIWCNDYFGSPRGRPSPVRPTRSRSVIPRHFDDPDLFEHLRSKVDFPKEIREYFAQQQPNQRLQPTVASRARRG